MIPSEIGRIDGGLAVFPCKSPVSRSLADGSLSIAGLWRSTAATTLILASIISPPSCWLKMTRLSLMSGWGMRNDVVAPIDRARWPRSSSPIGARIRPASPDGSTIVLRAHFGNDAVFMDIDSIPFGEDFREHIDTAVGQCDVVLAVIGPRWSGKSDASRRIDDPRDFVRIEIESALKRDIPVIPILIDRTSMPTEADLPPSLAGLTYRNAIDVDQGRDFHPHVDRLIRGIELLTSSGRQSPPPVV